MGLMFMFAHKIPYKLFNTSNVQNAYLCCALKKTERNDIERKRESGG